MGHERQRAGSSEQGARVIYGMNPDGLATCNTTGSGHVAWEFLTLRTAGAAVEDAVEDAFGTSKASWKTAVL
jgi:hypothetical protein